MTCTESISQPNSERKHMSLVHEKKPVECLAFNCIWHIQTAETKINLCRWRRLPWGCRDVASFETMMHCSLPFLSDLSWVPPLSGNLRWFLRCPVEDRTKERTNLKGSFILNRHILLCIVSLANSICFLSVYLHAHQRVTAYSEWGVVKVKFETINLHHVGLINIEYCYFQ